MNRPPLPLTLALSLALTGCGAAAATTSSATGTAAAEPAEEAPHVPELIGAWKQTDTASEDSYQQATITAETITVEWVTDGGDTTSIYWVGTFAPPAAAGSPYTWTSQRDAVATDSAILASTDDAKEFTYDGDTISYKVSALGTTTTVRLRKN